MLDLVGGGAFFAMFMIGIEHKVIFKEKTDMSLQAYRSYDPPKKIRVI